MQNVVLNQWIKRKVPCELLYFGVDLVRFNFKPEFEGAFFKSLFHGLSMNSPQNNNLYMFDICFTGVFSQTKDKRILSLFVEEDRVMVIEQILADTASSVEMSWCVLFDGSYFYKEGIENVLPQFIERYKDSMWIGRCDLCIDVTATVNDLYNNYTTNAVKGSLHHSGSQIESYYIGRKGKENKRHFIRVYDKILDTTNKGKFHLFADYILRKVVTRIEVQINSLSCKKYKVTPDLVTQVVISNQKERLQTDLYRRVFRQLCFNYHQTCFEIEMVQNLKVKIFKDLNEDEKTRVLDELQYAKRMLGYAKKLHGMGFNVISYLTSKL